MRNHNVYVNQVIDILTEHYSLSKVKNKFQNCTQKISIIKNSVLIHTSFDQLYNVLAYKFNAL